MREHKKFTSNLLLYIIYFLLNLLPCLLYYIRYRLESYNGYYTHLNLGIAPGFCFLLFIVFSVFFIPVLNEKLSLYSAGLFVFFAGVVLSSSIIGSLSVWKNVENSLILKATRYEIESITLTEFENVEDKDCIVYVGRPSCQDCVDAYSFLDSVRDNQPLKILYYDTDLDRDTNYESMMWTLQHYGVESVPAVVFVIDGKPDKTIFGDEIETQFEDTIHEYKTQNIYFNK